ncbi:MAG: hypothetical protein LZF86_10124 [Nitrospira sp.]|nr:MAG: hypothetical protein LZF86_10124 [Nitrospira sp.]
MWLAGTLAMVSVVALPLLGQAEDIAVPRSIPIPSVVAEIELSYVGERTTPVVTFSGPPAAAPSLPYRPVAPILDLRGLFGEPHLFGSCEGLKARMQNGIDLPWIAGSGRHCGQRIPLHQAEVALDLLSYETLRIRGRATGRVVVALEDRAGGQREDNLPLATVTGPFDLTLPLKGIGRKLDLRSLTALVVSAEAARAHIMFEQIEVAQPSSEPAVPAQPAGVGFWVWTYREAIRDPQAVLATCWAQRCSRVLIQMPSQTDDDELWHRYAGLLATIQQAGVAALALDGYPEAIQEPLKLAEKIERLLALVRPDGMSGVQLDIEPYLLPGFLQDEAQLRRYIETIETLKNIIGGRVRLSMVIPFWLASPTLAGRPLAYAVMDRVDEVAVMSYRTDLDDVQEIADDILRYGDLIGTRVWLAVETTPLPVEQHVVLRREPDSARADAMLDYDRRLLQWMPLAEGANRSTRREWFRIHHRFTVRPERLTFAGRSRAEVSASVKRIVETTSHPSFSGVIIHDLNGFRALAE